jgi:hypothetical protein
LRYLPCFVGPTSDALVNAVPGVAGALTCVRSNGVRPRLVSCEGSGRGVIGQSDMEAVGEGCAEVTVAAVVTGGGC